MKDRKKKQLCPSLSGTKLRFLVRSAESSPKLKKHLPKEISARNIKTVYQESKYRSFIREADARMQFSLSSTWIANGALSVGDGTTVPG